MNGGLVGGVVALVVIGGVVGCAINRSPEVIACVELTATVTRASDKQAPVRDLLQNAPYVGAATAELTWSGLDDLADEISSTSAPGPIGTYAYDFSVKTEALADAGRRLFDPLPSGRLAEYGSDGTARRQDDFLAAYDQFVASGYRLDDACDQAE